MIRGLIFAVQGPVPMGNTRSSSDAEDIHAAILEVTSASDMPDIDMSEELASLEIQTCIVPIGQRNRSN